MKLAVMISSMSQRALNACSSWSAAQLSKCALSFRSRREAGWRCSPQCSTTRSAGPAARKSTVTSGYRSRRTRAIARSRWMWPRPIGLDSHSTRRRLSRGRGRGGAAAGPAGVRRSGMAGMRTGSTRPSRTKSRMRRLTFTASRPKRPWPPSSKVTSRAPGMAATIFCACRYGTMRSRVPWMARVGTRTCGSRWNRSTPSIARRDSTRMSAVVSPAQLTPSSTPLSEWRSGNIRVNSRWRQPSKSPRITDATRSSNGCGTDSAYWPHSRIRCDSRSGCSTA